jgi:hypothetical protein
MFRIIKYVKKYNIKRYFTTDKDIEYKKIFNILNNNNDFNDIYINNNDEEEDEEIKRLDKMAKKHLDGED